MKIRNPSRLYGGIPPTAGKSEIRNWEGGLSMLEVLVAMAIMAIGIVGVLRVFSSSTMAAKSAESYSLAAILAQQAAFELERRPKIGDGRFSGSFGEGVPGYAWEADISSATSNGLRQAVITVSWQVGRRSRHFQLATCLPPRSGEESSPPTAEETPATEVGR